MATVTIVGIRRGWFKKAADEVNPNKKNDVPTSTPKTNETPVPKQNEAPSGDSAPIDPQKPPIKPEEPHIDPNGGGKPPELPKEINGFKCDYTALNTEATRILNNKNNLVQKYLDQVKPIYEELEKNREVYSNPVKFKEFLKDNNIKYDIKNDGPYEKFQVYNDNGSIDYECSYCVGCCIKIPSESSNKPVETIVDKFKGFDLGGVIFEKKGHPNIVLENDKIAIYDKKLNNICIIEKGEQHGDIRINLEEYAIDNNNISQIKSNTTKIIYAESTKEAFNKNSGCISTQTYTENGVPDKIYYTELNRDNSNIETTHKIIAKCSKKEHCKGVHLSKDNENKPFIWGFDSKTSALQLKINPPRKLQNYQFFDKWSVKDSNFVDFKYIDTSTNKHIDIIYGVPFENSISNSKARVKLSFPREFEDHRLQIELINKKQDEFYFKDLDTGLAYQKTSDGKVRLCEDNEFVNYENFDYTDAVRNFMLNNIKD